MGQGEVSDDDLFTETPGKIWVCGACGKRSRSRAGFRGVRGMAIDRGWDASCMLNAVLLPAEKAGVCPACGADHSETRGLADVLACKCGWLRESKPS